MTDIHIPGTRTQPPMTLRPRPIVEVDNPEIGDLAVNEQGTVAMWTGAYWLVGSKNLSDAKFRDSHA